MRLKLAGEMGGPWSVVEEPCRRNLTLKETQWSLEESMWAARKTLARGGDFYETSEAS